MGPSATYKNGLGFHVKHCLGVAGAVALALYGERARADDEKPPPVQWNASVLPGVAVYDLNGNRPAPRFSAFTRIETFFGRQSNRSFGIGPALFGGFTTLSETTLGGSCQVLLPTHELFPLTVGIGAFATNRERQSTRSGATASLGLALRSFNFHGTYAMAGGLLVEGRRDFHDAPVTTLTLSAQLDAAVLALPFVFAYNAFRLARLFDAFLLAFGTTSRL